MTGDLRFKDGLVYHFATSGSDFAAGAQLVGITDSNGNTITITRNANRFANVLQVTDPIGRSLVFNYDSSNRIISILDTSGGRQLTYSYNAQGTLATFIDAAGGLTSYTYDSNNRLLTMTDPRRVTLMQNTYDANGRVIMQVVADGGIYQLAYTLLNPAAGALSPVLSTTETDPRGNSYTYHFNGQGFLIDATDPTGAKRFFIRDPATNLILAIQGTGQCPVCGDPARGDANFTYDANGNQLTETDSLGSTTSFMNWFSTR